MLKRLFGFGKKPTPPPPPTLPPSFLRPTWGDPQSRYLDFFNLHLHQLSVDEAVAELTAKYLTPTPSTPVMLVYPHGEWVTVYCSPPFIATLGFNRLASDIARQREIWLIGYRVYANEGFDVHYFHRAEHVAGLAMGQGELEREPLSPEIFASLQDVSTLVPRPEALHPLDFHFALLEALGIHDAALTWEEALQKFEAGELPGAKLLPVAVSD